MIHIAFRLTPVLASLALVHPLHAAAQAQVPSLADAPATLPTVEVTTSRNCSVWQVLRYPAVVVTRAAWEAMKPRFTGEKTEETVA